MFYSNKAHSLSVD
jgi:uncharacterized protein YecE (DUF72 family)